jgi:hypothetical protein
MQTSAIPPSRPIQTPPPETDITPWQLVENGLIFNG